MLFAFKYKGYRLLRSYYITYIANVVIDLATAPPVLAPVIMMAGRTAADVAQVVFEPRSLGIFNVRYYFANDTSTPDLVCIHLHIYYVVIIYCDDSPCSHNFRVRVSTSTVL